MRQVLGLVESLSRLDGDVVVAHTINTTTGRVVRLFFQPVLVAWALWCTGAWAWWRSRRRG